MPGWLQPASSLQRKPSRCRPSDLSPSTVHPVSQPTSTLVHRGTARLSLPRSLHCSSKLCRPAQQWAGPSTGPAPRHGPPNASRVKFAPPSARVGTALQPTVRFLMPRCLHCSSMNFFWVLLLDTAVTWLPGYLAAAYRHMDPHPQPSSRMSCPSASWARRQHSSTKGRGNLS